MTARGGGPHRNYRNDDDRTLQVLGGMFYLEKRHCHYFEPLNSWNPARVEGGQEETAEEQGAASVNRSAEELNED